METSGFIYRNTEKKLSNYTNEDRIDLFKKDKVNGNKPKKWESCQGLLYFYYIS